MLKNILCILLILSLIIPFNVKANIVCNDNTISPTCMTCHPGCCSSHDGCTSTPNSYRGGYSNYDYSYDEIEFPEWFWPIMCVIALSVNLIILMAIVLKESEVNEKQKDFDYSEYSIIKLGEEKDEEDN